MSAQRRASIFLVAAGLAAGAGVEWLLVAVGAGRVVGVQLGAVFAPVVLLALQRPVRAAIRADLARSYLVFGMAWTVEPLVDHQLIKAVVIYSILVDVVTHTVGWIPVAVATKRYKAGFKGDLVRLEGELFRTSGRSSAAAPGRSEVVR